MSAKKTGKPKIARRKPGLVITPPTARPVQDNHPARLIFQEAIAAEKAAMHHDDVHSGGELGPPLNAQSDPNLHSAITHHRESLEAEGVTGPLEENSSHT